MIYLIRARYISVIQNMENDFLSSLIKEKSCHCLPCDIGEEGIMKRVTKSDIVGKGSKIWHFRGDVIFEWPHIP